jgi:Fe-S cluster biogenesis protein NfuA
MSPDANQADSSVAELTRRVIEVIEREVRPELQRDGSDVELVGIDAGDIVQVRLLGGCQGCAPIVYTLTMQVEAVLKARVPGVRLVEAVP